jgi:hypothetical protein
MTTQTATDNSLDRLTITSYAGNAWVCYTPDSAAGVYFSAAWGDIVRGEEAPIDVSIHPFAETTSVAPVASDRPSLASHITIDRLPLVVTLGMDGRIDKRAVLGEWIKFCDEAIECAAYECDCDEADLTIEEIEIGMRHSWRADPEDAERVAAVNAAA